jgi:hypothetical protein
MTCRKATAEHACRERERDGEREREREREREGERTSKTTKIVILL